MTEVNEGCNSSKVSSSFAPRKMPSLGSDDEVNTLLTNVKLLTNDCIYFKQIFLQSDVSSILLTEESDHIEKETQHRRNL